MRLCGSTCRFLESKNLGWPPTEESCWLGLGWEALEVGTGGRPADMAVLCWDRG